MRWCGCVSGQMRWARLALGKRGKPTLPNPKLGRCWPLTWGIQSLPLLILHLVLASYEQLLTAHPLTHPHNCPISRYLAPGEFFDEQRLADDRWRPLSTPPRSSINLVICSLPLQCMDLCTISVRTFLFPYFWIYAWSVWEFAGWWERESRSNCAATAAHLARPANPRDSPHSSWIYQNPMECHQMAEKNT